MPAVVPVIIRRVSREESEERPDLLTVEEPLEIRLGAGPVNDRHQRSLAVTMRTPGPGNDEELALGFLVSEGIIRQATDIISCRHCVQDAGKESNVIRVELHPDVVVDWSRLERHSFTSSSCGLCGKTSIEAVRSVAPARLRASFTLASDLVHALPRQLQEAQRTFAHTGGLHAAGLFDQTGRLLLVREDVGRHNALDKLIGAAFWQNWLPLSRYGIVLSGRIGFELVQKAWMAGVPLLAAVGAPSSSAVELAKEAGICLLGFVRENRFNIYSQPEAISVRATAQGEKV